MSVESQIPVPQIHKFRQPKFHLQIVLRWLHFGHRYFRLCLWGTGIFFLLRIPGPNFRHNLWLTIYDLKIMTHNSWPISPNLAIIKLKTGTNIRLLGIVTLHCMNVGLYIIIYILFANFRPFYRHHQAMYRLSII